METHSDGNDARGEASNTRARPRDRDSPIYVQGSPLRRNTFSQRELFLATTAALFVNAPSSAAKVLTPSQHALKPQSKRARSQPPEPSTANTPQTPADIASAGGAESRDRRVTEAADPGAEAGGRIGHHLMRYSSARRVAAAQWSLSQSATCRSLSKQQTLEWVAEYSRQQDDLVRRVSSPEKTRPGQTRDAAEHPTSKRYDTSSAFLRAARLADVTATNSAHGSKYVSVIERSADDGAADAQVVYEPRSPQRVIRTFEENLSLRSRVEQLQQRVLELEGELAEVHR